jgi:hypothetical protein
MYGMMCVNFYKMAFKIYTVLQIKKGFSKQIIPQHYYHIAIQIVSFGMLCYIQAWKGWSLQDNTGFCFPNDQQFTI